MQGYRLLAFKTFGQTHHVIGRLDANDNTERAEHFFTDGVIAREHSASGLVGQG